MEWNVTPACRHHLDEGNCDVSLLKVNFPCKTFINFRHNFAQFLVSVTLMYRKLPATELILTRDDWVIKLTLGMVKFSIMLRMCATFPAPRSVCQFHFRFHVCCHRLNVNILFSVWVYINAGRLDWSIL